MSGQTNGKRWWHNLVPRFAFPPAGTPTPRQQRENLEEELKLKKLQRASKFLENSQDFWLTSYANLLDRYSDGNTQGYPITQPNDRRYGSNFPFWVSEQQLSLVRAQARYCVTTSPNAQGLLNGLCSYVIGCGFTYRVVPKKSAGADETLVAAVLEIIDTFRQENAWAEMEQEIFTRSREDGEAFLRLFPQADGRLVIRTVEPEQITQPPGSDLREWSYGIQTDPDDVFEIKAYHVDYRAPGGKGEMDAVAGEVVDQTNIVHLKVNVKRSIKRGLSDFSYDTVEAFTQAAKLRRNLGEGAAVQAAIAAVRQHEASSVDQVTDFISASTDYSVAGFPGGKQVDFQRIEPGSFLDIPKGMNYIPPPAAANSAAHLEVMQGLLRSAGNRHNAPEWLASSDSSNGNFASSLTAEAPFTRHCLRLQEFYKGHFLRVMRAAVKSAAAAGILPDNILNLVEILATAPSVETRDKLGEANANQVYAGLGIKSKQTIAQELGLDWEQEETNQAEAASSQAGAIMNLPDDPMAQKVADIIAPQGV